MTDPIEFRVDYVSDNNYKITLLNSTNNYKDADVDDNIINVHNTPGIVLPSTGGIGSYSYYAVGTLLLTFAAFVYLHRRRHGEIV